MENKDWKAVYRRVKNKPIFMKEGRPSSALFKDSKGVSVDMDAERDEKQIIEDEEQLHKFYCRKMGEDEIKEKGEDLRAIIKVSNEVCATEKVCVISDPITGENENHALIQRSETEIQLTKRQAKGLARGAKIVKEYTT